MEDVVKLGVCGRVVFKIIMVIRAFRGRNCIFLNLKKEIVRFVL